MRNNNTKKIKKNILLGSILVYSIISLSIILLDHKSYAFLYYKFLPNIYKIHTKLEVSTGPMHYIEDVESKRLLKKFYPKLDSNEIELVGNTPYKYVNPPIHYFNDGNPDMFSSTLLSNNEN